MNGQATAHTVKLARSDDVDGFSAALRYLLHHDISPAQVTWDDGTQAQGDLFDIEAGTVLDRSRVETVAAGSIRLPRDFLTLARTIVLHNSVDRFRQLHAMAALLMRDRHAWADRMHPALLQLDRMAREVGREIHKMHAFVRFRPVVTEEGETHIAWFEPEHHVVRAAAPFFAKRFAAMHWTILTPLGCAYWDRHALVFAPPAAREDAPEADAGEALWLAYYRSIFNPARVKVDMMRREMPVRFWKNLPETGAITQLLHGAGERTYRMQNEVDEPVRKRKIRENIASKNTTER
ncbi:MAG: uracil-DNA glycosylase [Verrucomicrobiaceae bacterium]|nr:uracil-DNA glycosylase [Verrucomicrobiaceae bacterium]